MQTSKDLPFTMSPTVEVCQQTAKVYLGDTIARQLSQTRLQRLDKPCWSSLRRARQSLPSFVRLLAPECFEARMEIQILQQYQEHNFRWWQQP